MKEIATQSIVIFLPNSILKNEDDLIPDNANKGDYVKCHYLPSSHFGYIVERVGNEEND